MSLNTIERVEIEILSPFHIGSGHPPLVRDLDFVRAQQVYIIDQTRLFASLTPARLDRATAGARLSELLSVSDYRKFARYALNLPKREADIPQILDFVKTGDNRAYIPGSSLKGAIRTALAWAMLAAGEMQLEQRDIGTNPRFADDPFMGILFGSDPNHDLLRALQVSDTAGLAPNEGLELTQVQLYNLTRRDGKPAFGPKPDFEFYAETLRPGAKMRGELRFDEFLLKEPQASSLGFDQRGHFLREYRQHCNALARSLITKEKQFFEQYGPREVVSFYQRLEQTVARLDDTRECLLQMSWGTGWQSKTVGTMLSDALVKFAQTEFRLGREGQIVFPKTRRVTLRNGRPEAVMGWVKITS